jgi:hypothetical protein
MNNSEKGKWIELAQKCVYFVGFCEYISKGILYESMVIRRQNIENLSET